MKPSPNQWQLRLVNVSFVILLLTVVGLLLWLSRSYHMRVDLTQAGRHTLTEASIAVLKRMPEPLRLTAFASQRGGLRATLSDFVAKYQRHKPDIALEFVDPDTQPERVRAAGVQFDGELLLEYGDGKESLAPNKLTEENFTNALTRLGRRGERWVVFLSGHGERSPERQANFDLSQWADQLHKRGFKTRTLALGEHPQIPQNTSVLVIAGPRVQLLPGEAKEIENYVKRGGNLLWLHDPAPLYGLARIAEMLGIEFQPGVLVDPSSAAITGQANVIVVAKYPNHPIVRDFADLTLFPHAAGIAVNKAERWNATALLDTRPSAWSETGRMEGEIRFDKGKDIPGPLNLGVALTRELTAEAGTAEDKESNKREQRIVVIGDGDFLANAFLANAGNLQLGMSAINWLARDDAYVNIPVKAARDRTLALSRNAQYLIAGGFLIVLPLTLAGSGLVIWLRRRKR
ncbi:MAG: GldG family protein [Pseudomonadota bacterium]|nr:MAG: GldG family protein [Pseudomonadota bacterium]